VPRADNFNLSLVVCLYAFLAEIPSPVFSAKSLSTAGRTLVLSALYLRHRYSPFKELFKILNYGIKRLQQTDIFCNQKEGLRPLLKFFSSLPDSSGACENAFHLS
jgi:hypothetical protein